MRKTTADVVVRPRRASDDAFIYRLSERVFAPYSREPAGSMTSMLAERGALVFVAEHGARPAGFFVLGFERLVKSFGPWQYPAAARLNAIAVEPGVRRRGIGGLLVEHAEGRARDAGAVALTLMTAEGNAPARRLFAQAGFLPLFAIEQAYARGQRGILMTKAIDAG